MRRLCGWHLRSRPAGPKVFWADADYSDEGQHRSTDKSGRAHLLPPSEEGARLKLSVMRLLLTVFWSVCVSAWRRHLRVRRCDRIGAPNSFRASSAPSRCFPHRHIDRRGRSQAAAAALRTCRSRSCAVERGCGARSFVGLRCVSGAHMDDQRSGAGAGVRPRSGGGSSSTGRASNRREGPSAPRKSNGRAIRKASRAKLSPASAARSGQAHRAGTADRLALLSDARRGSRATWSSWSAAGTLLDYDRRGALAGPPSDSPGVRVESGKILTGTALEGRIVEFFDGHGSCGWSA